MGFMTAIKGLMSAPKVVDTATDLIKTGASGIDMMFYTDEEKEIARKDWFAMVLKSENTNHEQASQRSVTRRILARSFCETYLFLIIISVLLFKFDPAWGQYVFEMIKTVSYAVVPIIVFFFGAYGYGTYMKKKKGE